MTPLLKIGPLISLQDARSSAAMGFDIIAFSLARGSVRKLSAAAIWGMVQWLDGPLIGLELNACSLEELELARSHFDPAWIECDWADRQAPWPADIPLMVRLNPTEVLPQEAQAWLLQHEKSFLELRLETPFLPSAWRPLASRLFLHVVYPGQDQFHLPDISPAGWALSTEWEEGPGVLDYEAIDRAFEQYSNQL